MVLELSHYKRVEIELLERIMQAVEDRASVHEDDSNIPPLDESGSLGGIKKSSDNKFLVSMLGNILQQVSIILCFMIDLVMF